MSDKDTQKLCPMAVCDERFRHIAESLSRIEGKVDGLAVKVSNGLTSKVTSLRVQTTFQWWLLGGIVGGFGLIMLALAIKVARLQ